MSEELQAKMSAWATLHSSERQDWRTPPHLLAQAARLFGPFDLDAAAHHENNHGIPWIGPRYHPHVTPRTAGCVAVDSFATRWADYGSNVWLNPPYGRGVGRWVELAERQARTSGIRATLLIMARTDTAWWHDLVMARAAGIRFLRGRVVFECPQPGGGWGPARDSNGAVQAATAPSCFVVFDPDMRRGAGPAGALLGIQGLVQDPRPPYPQTGEEGQQMALEGRQGPQIPLWSE